MSQRGQVVPLGSDNPTGINILLPGIMAVQTDVAANWLPVLVPITFSSVIITSKMAPSVTAFKIDMLSTDGAGLNVTTPPVFVSVSAGAGWTLPINSYAIQIDLTTPITIPADSLLRFDILATDFLTGSLAVRWE